MRHPGRNRREVIRWRGGRQPVAWARPPRGATLVKPCPVLDSWHVRSVLPRVFSSDNIVMGREQGAAER